MKLLEVILLAIFLISLTLAIFLYVSKLDCEDNGYYLNPPSWINESSPRVKNWVSHHKNCQAIKEIFKTNGDAE